MAHEKIIDEIEQCISDLIKSYEIVPSRYLTEDDIRSDLYARLINKPFLGKLASTADGYQSIPVHAEVRWYGVEHKLKYRSDLVIFDPKSLKADKLSFEESSKGYTFVDYWASIELKLRRINGSGNRSFIVGLEKEQIRIEEVKNKTHCTVTPKYYQLVFDKKPLNFEEENQLRESAINRGINFSYTSAVSNENR